MSSVEGKNALVIRSHTRHLHFTQLQDTGRQLAQHFNLPCLLHKGTIPRRGSEMGYAHSAVRLDDGVEPTYLTVEYSVRS